MWRNSKRLGCPTRTPLAAKAHGPLCPECQTMDRSNSIAADTRLDDPREFAVYLAHHGSRVKIGITAADRGIARLLEQGALSSAFLSSGTLAAARRVEKLFTSAFGVTDRVMSPTKRTARLSPPTAAERVTDLQALADNVSAIDWPDGQTLRTLDVIDHSPTYGLPADGIQPAHALTALAPYDVVSGRLACHIARDLYLETPQGLVIADTQLLSGWPLTQLDASSAFTARTEPIAAPVLPQDALF
ncbi:DUF2797 domain-containing protein [Kribbella antibiotica]|uniref:DUF2797 domain-containing protein n=1 Tax=Kribbella antibiotica TaxID=190195 RepID=A0A4R4ZK09_9ACTN|nr:DUF2797 domain-containing protein [Kribbella antibiotica]